MVEIFNLIYNLKDVKESELILNEDDMYIINQFYKLVKKYIRKITFINVVKQFQITTCNVDTYECCDILTTEIIKTYGKR